MSWRPHGRARVDARDPHAFAWCDRCQFQYNLNSLRWQYQWQGPQLQNLRLLVCETCYDEPQEGLRTFKLPPDPVPVFNPRPPRAAGDGFGDPVPNQDYSGPADVVGAVDGWWGLRAASAARIGQNALQLRASGDNAIRDIPTIEGGGLSINSIIGFQNAHGGHLTCVALYDQSGNGRHVTPIGSEPLFTLDAGDGLPALDNTSNSNVGLGQNGPFFYQQPFTEVAVAKRAQATTPPNFGTVFSSHNRSFGIWFIDGGLQLYGNSNSFISMPSPNNTWRAIVGVTNGANSYLKHQDNMQTLDIGNSGFDDQIAFICDGGPNDNLVGYWREAGFWLRAFNDTQANNMIANQRAFWGF